MGNLKVQISYIVQSEYWNTTHIWRKILLFSIFHPLFCWHIFDTPSYDLKNKTPHTWKACSQIAICRWASSIWCLLSTIESRTCPTYAARVLAVIRRRGAGWRAIEGSPPHHEHLACKLPSMAITHSWGENRDESVAHEHTVQGYRPHTPVDLAGTNDWCGRNSDSRSA